VIDGRVRDKPLEIRLGHRRERAEDDARQR
jgi:hypothetical protein